MTDKIQAKTKKALLLLFPAAAFLAAAAVLWLNGAFLPSWTSWKETSLAADLNGDGQDEVLTLHKRRFSVTSEEDVLFETPRQWKVSGLQVGDINRDGADEILLLVWKRGSYGQNRPFWVGRDEIGFSQHIFIYHQTNTGRIRPLWMSSRVGIRIRDWTLDDDMRIHLFSTDGEETIWAWEGFGLTLVEKPEGHAGTEGRTAEPCRLTLFAAGDNLIHESIYRHAYDRETGRFDFHSLYAEIRDTVSSYGLSVINQETILTDNPSWYGSFPLFGTPEEIGDAIADAGFDIVLHATNHANDRGSAAIRSTLSYWSENHPEITVLGIRDPGGTDPGDGVSSAVYLTKNDITLALFNYTYGLNGRDLPENEDRMVDQLKNEDRLVSDLLEAEQEADLSVCFLHTGEEYSFAASDAQTDLCGRLADAGADVIICSHPHVIEPFGRITTGKGNTAIVYYSCGNFISDTHRFEALLGGAACLTIEKTVSDSTAPSSDGDTASSKTVVSDFDFLPLVTHFSEDGYRVYRLDEYTDELAASHSVSRAGEPFTTEDLHDLWNSVVSPP